MMNTAVLLLIFNRPNTTRRVFEAIRAARPSRLYIAGDGPRAGRQDDVQRCEEARTAATKVDWPCEVKTLFRETNLGCKRGPSEGIDWLFQHEEEGIILEDDVVPLDSFFPFCEELLERYRCDPRISMISGSNFIVGRLQSHESYSFIRYGHIWGWATWKRAWKDYDGEMKDWPSWRDNGGLRQLSHGRPFESHWRNVFDKAYSRQIDDAWDYLWQFACWRTSRLSVQPSVNLTQNIGFCPDGTHTRSVMPDHVRSSLPCEMRFPLRHPAAVVCSQNADAMIDKVVFGISRRRYLLDRVKQIPLLGAFAVRIAAHLRATGR
jgi:hypothetical protein